MPHRLISEIIKNQSILTTTADTTVIEAAALMQEARVGAIMIVEDRDGKMRLDGIFTERDALYKVIAHGMNPTTTPLRHVMSLKVCTITPDRPFSHALHIMYDQCFRHMPVVDHDFVPIGMVSVRDALGPEMEQFAAELHEREHIAEIMG